jgi:hypothetical protein
MSESKADLQRKGVALTPHPHPCPVSLIRKPSVKCHSSLFLGCFFSEDWNNSFITILLSKVKEVACFKKNEESI